MRRIVTVPFTEPVPIVTIHSHRLAFLDVLGSDFHFALCLQQPMTGVKGGHEYVINNRISMPIAGVMEGLPRVISRLPVMAASELTERIVASWRGGRMLS